MWRDRRAHKCRTRSRVSALIQPARRDTAWGKKRNHTADKVSSKGFSWISQVSDIDLHQIILQVLVVIKENQMYEMRSVFVASFVCLVFNRINKFWHDVWIVAVDFKQYLKRCVYLLLTTKTWSLQSTLMAANGIWGWTTGGWFS